MVAGWNDLAQKSPLAQADWSSYFQDQVPSTGWWNQVQAPFAYGQGTRTGQGMDYDPGSVGDMYTPTSSLSFEMISGDIDQYMAREHPELFDFTADWQQGGVAGVGKVAESPGFGQFGQDPGVYGEIQAAASKHGVPANFLQAIIAAESSGDWAGNGNRTWNGRPQSGPLLPYIGVFQDTAMSRTGMSAQQFQALVGDRPGQIDLLARVLRSQYDELHTKNPKWGWSNVASYHYSGFADPVANPWSDESGNGSNLAYMTKITNWWKDLDRQAGNTWSDYTSTGQNTGVGSPNSREWAPVNQWDPMVAAAAQKYGVPANLIKAIMRTESGGDATAVSPQGATGLMQVMPFHVNGDQSVLLDPAQNIDVGTRILMDNYRTYGTWEMAAQAYLGLGGADAHGTTSSVYWGRVKSYWDELNADGSGMFGGAPGPSGPMLQTEAVWGGLPYSISQKNGYSDFAVNEHPEWYEYSVGVLGYMGHPGDDVAIPEGTTLYAPQGGTVILDGNTGSYTYGGGDGPHSGELRIRLDNGDELILGHTQSIGVRVGDRVEPGQAVAVSGWAGTGDHLHLEYRTPDPAMSSGWRSVDPFEALSGQFTGKHQGARTGLGYTQPLTFQALMRAGASGAAIPDGPVYSMGGGRSSWNSWLRRAMAGAIPSGTGSSPYKYTYALADAF